MQCSPGYLEYVSPFPSVKLKNFLWSTLLIGSSPKHFVEEAAFAEEHNLIITFIYCRSPYTNFIV